MKICGYNWDSLNRHRVTAEMIDEVLQSSMVCYFPIESDPDSCELVVGYTFSERILEVGVRYLTEDSVFIFHAQSVSPQYRKRFFEEWDIG